MKISVERFSGDIIKELLAFFDREDQGFCYCRFWHFRGPNEAWLSSVPSDNRAALIEDAARDEVDGVVARAGDEVVGWLRLGRADRLPKLAEQELESSAANAASILCMSVAEEHRGQGVARAMLEAALHALRQDGANEVHAYPRPQDAPEAGAVWTGPRALYASLGFRVVDERGGRRITMALRL